MSQLEKTVAQLPQSDDLRLVRLAEVLARVPIGRSTWWAGVADGRFPRPVRLGRTVAWRLRDILAIVQHGVA